MFFLPLALAAAPIPASVPGYELGTAGAPVSLEMFADFSCDDSANAWKTIVKPLVEAYKETASIIYYAFPLPYHHNSFDASQAGRVMTDYLSRSMPLSQAFTTAADALFGQQTRFMSWQTPNPTANLTQGGVISAIFADIAADAGVPRDFFMESMGIGWNMTYFEPTRDTWKWGAAKGVSATPTFAANGVFSDALDSWTLANWTAFLNPPSRV